MAPRPSISANAVVTICDDFLNSLSRAESLYNTICINGYTQKSTATQPTKLLNADTRDAAQFIFLEIAAKFEGLAKHLFEIETRSKFSVTIKVADYIMGDSDKGTANKLGWGSVSQLYDRGKNLFGNQSFFGNLSNEITNPVYSLLIDAHKIRNRIAHEGASKKFIDLLIAKGVQKQQRKGMTVGRFLCEYPRGATSGNEFFFVYLNAYKAFATTAKNKLP